MFYPLEFKLVDYKTFRIEMHIYLHPTKRARPVIPDIRQSDGFDVLHIVLYSVKILFQPLYRNGRLQQDVFLLKFPYRILRNSLIQVIQQDMDFLIISSQTAD